MLKAGSLKRLQTS